MREVHKPAISSAPPPIHNLPRNYAPANPPPFDSGDLSTTLSNARKGTTKWPTTQHRWGVEGSSRRQANKSQTYVPMTRPFALPCISASKFHPSAATLPAATADDYRMAPIMIRLHHHHHLLRNPNRTRRERGGTGALGYCSSYGRCFRASSQFVASLASCDVRIPAFSLASSRTRTHRTAPHSKAQHSTAQHITQFCPIDGTSTWPFGAL